MTVGGTVSALVGRARSICQSLVISIEVGSFRLASTPLAVAMEVVARVDGRRKVSALVGRARDVANCRREKPGGGWDVDRVVTGAMAVVARVERRRGTGRSAERFPP